MYVFLHEKIKSNEFVLVFSIIFLLNFYKAQFYGQLISLIHFHMILNEIWLAEVYRIKYYLTIYRYIDIVEPYSHQ